MAQTKQTPMMQQYFRMKAQHPGVILFFQLGDFYETFYEDAELCARELDIALTQREGQPMAGVPIKKSHLYLNRLLRRGHKVALCDQVQDPNEAKGPVEREVVRVVTPGTVLDEDVLDRGKQNHIAALVVDKERVGLAVADVSTGEFRATELTTIDEAKAELARLQPSEIVFPDGDVADDGLTLDPDERQAHTTVEPRRFRSDVIEQHFGIVSLDGLGLSELSGRAAGGLLHYLQETQKAGLNHLKPPTAYSTSNVMGLDPFTQRNLELVRELRTGGEQHTLLSILNDTSTGMGERCLRSWVLSPLLDRDEIDRRQDMVELFHTEELARAELRDLLSGIYDIERLAGKLGAGRSTPRDLLSLKQSLAHLPALRQQLGQIRRDHDVARLMEIAEELNELALDTLVDDLQRALREDAPFTLSEGGIIQEGFSEDLDEVKGREREQKQSILDLENHEQQTTGIPSLKVGYNSVFGYYLEVTRTHSDRVPERYTRKQSLKSAERYITPELKEHEEKVLSAQERAQKLEYDLFCQLRDRAAEHVRELQTLAARVAELDVYASLAEVAKRRGYVRPAFSEARTIEISGGRHPVVEILQADEAFVPNDLDMASDETLVVLTGPNMSGKSTFLRQTALVCLMAQMRSFVPADRAQLPIVDKIFTRVGASDMLAFGYSTFMVEMIEAAQILNNATENSLVILDEMGRGTSTFDGVSIAWAVAEHLVSTIGAKTLFATHYHELTLLANKLPGVVNMTVLVKDYGDDVIFLHQVERGEAEGSYGVHVAKLAGLPEDVINTASNVLNQILQGNPLEAIEGRKPTQPKVIKQPSLFGGEPHPVVEKLKEVDVENLTPIEALNLIHRLKETL